jgi:glycosyltransferase involved in cell wall biosynthesis
MFGWEFPPFISGGLGTACQGIVRGLLKNGVDVSFVLPTTRGRKAIDDFRIIPADQVPFLERDITDVRQLKDRFKVIDLKFKTLLSPYFTSEFRERHLDRIQTAFTEKREDVRARSVLNFTGNYGNNLFFEVLRYGLVGEELGRTEPFDVIHSHDWLTFPAGVAAKAVSGKPLVVHVHATEFDRSGENVNQDVYNIERFGMENADRVVCVSHYTRNIVINRYGVPPGKIEVVHNAVNKECHLQRLGINKPLKEKIVLFLGRITMQKGPEYFLEAANLVLKKVKDVRFVMAGSGDMLTRMIARMARLNLARRFHFTGFLQGLEVERMYALSDLYVMPSVSEPFGISAFEALLYDVPIIISKQSGVAEVLPEAVIVDFWDTRKLAESIVSILSSETLSRRIVDKCQDRVEQIGWEHAGRKLASVYGNLTGRG